MLDGVTVPVEKDQPHDIYRLPRPEPEATTQGGRGRLALAASTNDSGPFPGLRLRADILEESATRRNRHFGHGLFQEAWIQNESDITERGATVERLLNAVFTLLNSAPNDFAGMRLRLEVARFLGDFLLDGQKNERRIASVPHLRVERPNLRLSLLSMIETTVGKGPAA